MTAPHDPRWLELLAAYADDELEPAARAKVEKWLAAHPEARDELRNQRRYSPNNWRLWAKAEPALPSDAAWGAVLRGVEAGLTAKSDPAPRRERSRWKFAVAAAGLAAGASAAAWLVGGPATPVLPAVAPADPPVAESPYAEFAALPMSSDADVDLLSVPGGAERWLPVGVPPLSGGLVLASAGDVTLEDAEPNPAWPGGVPKMTTAAGDAPMLFVSRP